MLRIASRKIGYGISLIFRLLVWVWAIGALHFAFYLPGILAVLLIPVLPIMWLVRPVWRSRIFIAQAVFTFLVIAGLLITLRASNDRDWWDENRVQPTAVIDQAEGTVSIRGIRGFRWKTRTDYTAGWSDREFRLADAQTLDLIIEPLGDSKYFAHSMLSFGFGEAGGQVVISVEVRREKGEEFGLLPGLYGQFELMYQVLDERDALTLRALDPNSHLYIYPVAATPEFIRVLFVDLLREANSLADRPRFYHSLRANCTTKLFDHMNRVIDEPLGYRKEVLFPSMAGKLLAEMGWLGSELPYEQAKENARAAERVRRFADDPEFSRKIRNGR